MALKGVDWEGSGLPMRRISGGCVERVNTGPKTGSHWTGWDRTAIPSTPDPLPSRRWFRGKGPVSFKDESEGLASMSRQNLNSPRLSRRVFTPANHLVPVKIPTAQVRVFTLLFPSSPVPLEILSNIPVQPNPVPCCSPVVSAGVNVMA